MRPKRGLFVTYNGALEPLVQSQGLPYLKELVHRGWQISLLSFERWDGDRVRWNDAATQLEAQLQNAGIRWYQHRYHKRPPILSTLWDVLVGFISVWRRVREDGQQVLHARGTIPALMVWPAARLTRCPWLFDVRGLVAEEYVDARIWPRGSLRYRLARVIERWLIRRADALVVLTERMAQHLGRYAGSHSLAPTRVIPCCVDLARFPWPPSNHHTANADSCAMVYLGSVGTWYLLDEMFVFFSAWQRHMPHARFLIISQSPRPLNLEAHCLRAGVDPAKVEFRSVSPDDVARELARARCGIALIQPSFSKSASSPTKIGEYLAAGLPVVVNAGVGDLAEFVGRQRVGVVVEHLTPAAHGRAAEELVMLLKEGPSLAQRCRQAAEASLSLTLAGERYSAIYDSLRLHEDRS